MPWGAPPSSGIDGSRRSLLKRRYRSSNDGCCHEGPGSMKVSAMKVSAMTAAGGRPLSALILGAAMSGFIVSAGWAQTGIMPGGQDPIAAGRRAAAPTKPALAPADAMPGAKAREPAAPATRAAGDMQPTEALFDSINRGDIASARDALSRGADLNGVNVLGMTPMELSVDLGRNDISFLLLSMRGEDSGRGSRSVGRDNPGPAPAPAVNTAKAAKPSAPVRGAQVVAKPLATPKLFANDGGTPLPNAGFLGFDSRSATN
jgi:hypothetical protein